MKRPPEWTKSQLERQAKIASGIFRKARLRKPLTVWLNAFDEYREKFQRLFDEYGVQDPNSLTPESLVGILDDNLGEALRYLAGPPISNGDLRVLADTSLTSKSIAGNPAAARRVLKTIMQSIDPRRFPWISEKRPPRPSERAAAILASAALITAQRVATNRRNEGKREQEDFVRAYLKTIALKEVRPRTIRTLSDAPEKGEFCGECHVGSRKADIAVRLNDGRLMPIECKVSNSALNSLKRLNNDAAVKAKIWREEFGKSQIVPVAVLSGVFNVSNLLQAQEPGLTLFWAHKLDDMGKFIAAAVE